MNGYWPVLGQAKGALILLALSLMLALGLEAGLVHFRGRAQTSLVKTEAALQAKRTEVQALTYDAASLKTHLAGFRHLSRIGLIGDPDRETWVRNLETIYSELKLPPTLRYTLATPQPFTAPEIAAGKAQPVQAKALYHDLDIELSALHEGEFLTFMERLGTDWQAPFRVESCQITRDSKPGLLIKCTLRLFSLPLQDAGSKSAGSKVRKK